MRATAAPREDSRRRPTSGILAPPLNRPRQDRPLHRTDHRLLRLQIPISTKAKFEGFILCLLGLFVSSVFVLILLARRAQGCPVQAYRWRQVSTILQGRRKREALKWPKRIPLGSSLGSGAVYKCRTLRFTRSSCWEPTLGHVTRKLWVTDFVGTNAPVNHHRSDKILVHDVTWRGTLRLWKEVCTA